MQNYTELDGAARYDRLSELAAEVFGPRWKGALAEKYGIRAETVSSWGNKGAPAWVLAAMLDAVKVKRVADAGDALDALRATLAT